jgi:hypothetical protein
VGSAQSKASVSTGQHNTQTRGQHPYLKWDSNPRSQFSRDQDPRLGRRSHCNTKLIYKLNYNLYIIVYFLLVFLPSLLSTFLFPLILLSYLFLFINEHALCSNR